MNRIDFALKLKGFPVKRAQNKLLEIQEIKNQDYKSYIEKAKKDIVKFHLENNKFYASFVKEKYTGWSQLPVLKKTDLQIPIKERLSEGYNLNMVYQNKTSGSTGNPLHFAKDNFSHALTWSVIKNRFDWHGVYGKKQARFYGAPKEFIPRTKEKIKDLLSNRKRFDVFNLTDDAFNKWIKDFKKNNYFYLNGYTSVIVCFADYLITKKLILKEICPSLKVCVVTSEMCTENDIKIMHKAFGIPIINEYGASELDLIAFQNTQNEWVINNETLHIEILDNNNNILPFGEVGKIVITSLYNKAHPFIRYEIGDLGSLKMINDKKIVLEKLIGRKEDVIKLPSGKTSPGLTIYYITKNLMKNKKNIKEVKVIQKTINSFEIHYTGKEKLNKEEEEDIKKSFEKYLEPNLNVIFYKFEKLERSKSGKLQQFRTYL